MSKKSSETLTSSQRAELAAQVKSVRLKLGLTQQELANEAGVTRQSVGNIELGATIPQASTLLPVLQALGISPKAAEFSAETSRWLAVVGGIMDSIPLDRRDQAGRAAVEAVTDELVASANVGGSVDDELPHIGEVDVEKLRQEGHALAADEREGFDKEQEQSQELP